MTIYPVANHSFHGTNSFKNFNQIKEKPQPKLFDILEKDTFRVHIGVQSTDGRITLKKEI